MQNMIETINIFHYEQFWRLKGERQVSHKCGGVLTLLIFLFLGAITGYEMVLVAKKTTVTYKAQSQIDFSVSFTNITTSQSDSDSQPFMAAVLLMDLNTKIIVSTDLYNVTARYVTKIYNNKTSGYQFSSLLVSMQKCTPNHFSRIAFTTERFYNIGIGNWACIPVNRTFQIGGNIIVDDTKYLVVDIKCRDDKPNCIQHTNQSILVQLMTLNNFVNPNNDSQSFLAYFNRRQSVFQPKTGYRNFVYLDKNILKTDLSLSPISQFSFQQCFEESFYVNHDQYVTQNSISQYFIVLSGKTITYSREYLKVLTALSFIGGLFTPIIGLISIISMMSKFGTLVYEMRFAKCFFKDKHTTNFNYLKFFSHIIYKLLELLNYQPNWQLARRRDRLKQTVRNLLDVIYLQRRISFLQKALTVLFDKNQLKGLYLLQTTTKEEVDQIYQKYKLRSKVFKLYKRNSFRNGAKNKNLEINLYPLKQSQVKDGNTCYKQKTQKLVNKYNQIDRGQKNQHEKNQICLRQDRCSKQSDQISSAYNIFRNHQIDEVKIAENDAMQELDFRDDFDLEFTQDISQRQAETVKLQILQLNSLIAEAKQNGGDWRSKKIVSLLDQNIIKIIQKLSLYQK